MTKKKPSIIVGLVFVFVLIATSIFTFSNGTAYARGGGRAKVSVPSGGYHSGSFQKPTPHVNTNSGNHTTINNHTTVYNSRPSFSPWGWFMFYPHHSVYYDSYGVSHSMSVGFSFMRLLLDVFVVMIIGVVILYLIKALRR